MRSWVSRFLPVVAWMGVIFFLSAQPQLPSPEDPWLNVVIKKLGHITVYAILALLWLRATASPLGWKQVILCLFVVCVYGLSDEYHQSFVANRTPAITDVLFDVVGGSVGVFLWKRLQFTRTGRILSRH